jgi:hypothetical protein
MLISLNLFFRSNPRCYWILNGVYKNTSFYFGRNENVGVYLQPALKKAQFF